MNPSDSAPSDAKNEAQNTDKIAMPAIEPAPSSERVSAPIGAQKPEGDPVEAALAKALEGATEAKRWDVVAQLAGELEARRRVRSNVRALGEERDRRRLRKT